MIIGVKIDPATNIILSVGSMFDVDNNTRIIDLPDMSIFLQAGVKIWNPDGTISLNPTVAPALDNASNVDRTLYVAIRDATTLPQIKQALMQWLVARYRADK